MGWRRNAGFLGGGCSLLLLLLVLKRCRRQLAVRFLPDVVFKASSPRMLQYYWHVLKNGDSSGRQLWGGFLGSLIKPLLEIRWLIRPVSAPTVASTPPPCLMCPSSSKGAEVNCNIDEPEQTDDDEGGLQEAVYNTTRGGLWEIIEESRMLDLDPRVILIDDDPNPNSGSCTIDGPQQPEDDEGELEEADYSTTRGGLREIIEEPRMLDLDPRVILIDDDPKPNSGTCTIDGPQQHEDDEGELEEIVYSTTRGGLREIIEEPRMLDPDPRVIPIDDDPNQTSGSCNLDGPQQTEDDVSKREQAVNSTTHGGLLEIIKEQRMLDSDPCIISIGHDPHQTSGCCNIDGAQQPENQEGELEEEAVNSTTHGGLWEIIEEPRMLDPDLRIISMDDPNQTCGRCFFMKSGLPRVALQESGGCCSLAEWLTARQKKGIIAMSTLKGPGLSAPVNYVRNEIKVLIKSLIQFVQYIHNQGRCMNGSLKPSNISVDGDNLKFDNLELSSFTKELQEKDYGCFYGMIMSSFLRKKTKELPYDMQQFLKLLKNPGPHVYLISKHIALMNMRSCRHFIMLLWDRNKMMNPTVHSKWQDAIENLTGIDCWSKAIAEGSYLWKVYKGGKYKDSASKIHLIRFFRNAAAHLGDHSGKGELFQFEHISLIITASFPTVLADLQERLNHHGILQEFL